MKTANKLEIQMKKFILFIFLISMFFTSCDLNHLFPADGILENVGIWVDPVNEVEDENILLYHKGDSAELWITIIPDFNSYKTYNCNVEIQNDNNGPYFMKFIDEGKGFVADEHTVNFSLSKDDCTKLAQIDSEPYTLRAVIPIEMLHTGINSISGNISTNNGYSDKQHYKIKVVE